MSGQLPLTDGIKDEDKVLENATFGYVEKEEEVVEHPFHIASNTTKERHESIDQYQSTPPSPDPERADERPDLRRTESGYSVALSVVKVPRAQRAGLFGRFTILYEAEEPKDYPRKIKWTITFIIAICAMAAPIGSAILLRKPTTAPEISSLMLTYNHQPPSTTS